MSRGNGRESICRAVASRNTSALSTLSDQGFPAARHDKIVTPGCFGACQISPWGLPASRSISKEVTFLVGARHVGIPHPVNSPHARDESCHSQRVILDAATTFEKDDLRLYNVKTRR